MALGRVLFFVAIAAVLVFNWSSRGVCGNVSELTECQDFTVLPEDVAISAGDQICLYCDYPGNNSEEWLKDGMTVDMELAPCNCFLNVTGNVTALCFNAFDSGDAGQYTCTVNGTACTANATVLLASDNFTQHPVDVSAVEGENVTFSCALESGLLNYQWLFTNENGIEMFLVNDPPQGKQWSGCVITHSSYEISPEDGALTLLTVSNESSGTYQCAYEQTPGIYLYSDSATLTYLGQAFSSVPQPTTALMGSTAEFQCITGENIPAVSLSWIVDGLAATSQTITSRGITFTTMALDSTLSSVLSIPAREMNNDTLVQCVANEQYFSDQVRLTVQVLVVGFEQGAYAVSEDAGSLQVCVTAKGTEYIPEGDMATVSIAREDGTAVVGSDYEDNILFDIPITSSFSIYCNIYSIIDDTLVEATETFSFSLNTTNATVTLEPANSTVEIQDNDVLVVDFTQSEYIASEDEPSGVLQVCLSIMGQVEGDLSPNVNVSTQDGTAVAGMDYLAYMETLIDVLIEGVDEYCVDIRILDDSVVEGEQSFSVTLDSTDDYVVYTTDVPVIIQDNDFFIVGFTQSEYTTNEDFGSTEAFISVSGELEDLTPTVTLTPVDGTAKNGVDYEAFPEVYTDLLVEVQGSFSVDLAILDNQIPDGDKFFYLVLNSTDDFVAFSNINTTIIILDNDDLAPIANQIYAPEDCRSGIGKVITKREGQEVSLTVEIMADPCPSVTWMVNGGAIDVLSNPLYSADDPCTGLGFVFNFTLNISSDTEGNYSAYFVNEVGDLTTEEVLVTSEEPVQIVDILINTKDLACLLEGSDTTIRCVTQGFPQPTITFFKDGEEIVFDDRIILGACDELDIAEVQASDGGVYSCMAMNSVGEPVQDNVSLQYCAPPVITELTVTDASPTVGEDITITCIVDGEPIPDEVWQKDGVNINSNGHILTFFVNFDTPRYGLTIFEVVPEDTGVYTCVISNIAGETSEELEIEVEGVPCGEELVCLNGGTCDELGFVCLCTANYTGRDCTSEIVPPPEVVITTSIPPPGKPSAGDNFTATCEVIYYDELLSPIEIVWTNSEGAVLTTTEYLQVTDTEPFKDTVARTLIFPAVRTSQGGMYTCIARVNSTGFIEEVTVNAELELFVRISNPESIYLSLSPSDEFFAGSILTLSCAIVLPESVDTAVMAEIQWTPNSIYSDNNILISTATQFLNTAVYMSVVTFNPVLFSNAGAYFCQGAFFSAQDSAYVIDQDDDGGIEQSIIVNAQAPQLNVTIEPESVIIANVAPYNEYTLTCTATLPNEVTGLEYDFQWTDQSGEEQQLLSPSDTINITYQSSGSMAISTLHVIDDGSRNEYIVSCGVVAYGTHEGAPNEDIVNMDGGRVFVTANGLDFPEPAVDVTVVGTSFELAIIQWRVPLIAYIPETYTIQYKNSSRADFVDGNQVVGTMDLTATDVVYTSVLEGLEADTEYQVRIVSSVSTNFGSLSATSQAALFFTRQQDAYEALVGTNFEVPLGAPILIQLGFFIFPNAEMGPDYQFVPLGHTPLQQPNFTTIDSSIVDISYNHASPSLNGTYVLCFGEFQPEGGKLCGGKIIISVTIPTLTISTDLLVIQIPSSGVVSCTPSDPEAPVQWTTSTGAIPVGFPVIFSRGLSQVATFTAISRSNLTDVFICDLINVEEPNRAVDPQRVSVRFVSAPVVILNDDRELASTAIINSFPSLLSTNQPILNLRCLSIREHGDLQWQTRDVASLPGVLNSDVADMTEGLTILYGEDEDRRDVIVTYQPIDSTSVGYYTCASQESGYTVDVYTTLTDPLWEVTTPNEYSVPIGVTVDIIALYADASFGYTNWGAGFQYELKFIPCTEVLPEEVLAVGVTDSQSNVFSYSFNASLDSAGIYQLNASHIQTGMVYFHETHVNISEPELVEYDPVVYVQRGKNVTLRCVPSDLRAPILWNIQTMFSEVPYSLQSVPQVFLFSPPDLNHMVTFNATNVALMFDGFVNEVHRIEFQCGLQDGNDLYNAVYFELYIQQDRIRVHHTISAAEIIHNNTVINSFPPSTFNTPRFKREVGGSPSGSPPPLPTTGCSLYLECTTSHGDHIPVWFNETGVVPSDGGDIYGYEAISTSDYTAMLLFYCVTPVVAGTYSCVSQLSGLFTQFYTTPENPFIRAISPENITVLEGDPVRLEFQVAVDSNGNYWSTETIEFHVVTGDEMEFAEFTVYSPEYPQNYALDYAVVSRIHAGTYIARAQTTASYEYYYEYTGPGNYEYTGSGAGEQYTQRNITLTVIPTCPLEVNGGIFWPRSIQGEMVQARCSDAGSFYRVGTMATRRCTDVGEWAAPDFTSCTLVGSSEPFLLLWFVIDANEISDSSRDIFEEEMAGLLSDYNVPYTTVSLQSVYIASVSLTFEVTLNSSASDNEQAFSEFMNFFNIELTSFGGFAVLPGARGSLGVIPSDSCPCASGRSDSSTFIQLCGGASLSPCACSEEETCVCRDPFVGDGNSCTLDTDGDGYPDTPLQSCTEDSTEIYCIKDVCPNVSNVNQDPTACQPDAVISIPEFDGCPYGPDPTWNITWGNTARGMIDIQRCPGGVNTLGMASRQCGNDGNWVDPPDVLDCVSLSFVFIEQQVNSLGSSSLSTEQLQASSTALTLQLTVATETETISLLPLDLNATNYIISDLLDAIQESNITNEDLIEIIDNTLEDTNSEGWNQLQTVDAGSQLLLDNVERFGLLLANALNDTTTETTLSRPNIVIRAKQVSVAENVTLVFPAAGDLVNYTVQDSQMPPAQIRIPGEVLEERSGGDEDSTIPVVAILFRNLQDFLPSFSEELQNSRAVSTVISAQVGSQRGVPASSEALQQNPISLTFNFEMVEDALEYLCSYWNYSLPIGNGSWVSTGVETTDIDTDKNTTTVNCESTHLTSFAVLVDVSGGLQGISEEEELALQVVSYVGCIISVICLIITIVFFLMQGKKLFVAVHYFVHLNLAISLLLGYLLFMVGIETATSSTGGCAFVAALLQYFFLAAFCWMLCEGIMLFLMLVVVFSTLSKKWWFFLLIGYGVPIPLVVIGLAARHDYYGVRVDGDLAFCWLSSEKGTIWAFVAPMLVIIMVNVVFLILTLRSLWRNKKGQKAQKMEELDIRELTKTIFRATIILLPLLGLTWIFGILTLNRNATVFAWLFTIFNSLQGLGILFFHVIRSDKIWNKIGPRLTVLRQKTFTSTFRRSYDVSSGTGSTLLKGTFNRKPAAGSVELGTLPSHTSSSKETAMTSVASSPPQSNENGSEVTAFVNPEFDKMPFPSEDEVKPELPEDP